MQICVDTLGQREYIFVILAVSDFKARVTAGFLHFERKVRLSSYQAQPLLGRWVTIAHPRCS